MGAFEFSWLSDRPRTWWDAQSFHAASSLQARLLSLGSLSKRLAVNRVTKTLEFECTMLWVLKTRHRIPFAEIKEIAYRYDNWTWLSWMRAADAYDVYSIVLEFHDHARNDLLLFRFYGAGEFDNNTFWPDIVYWQDYLFDATGTQKKDSLAFYEAIKSIVFPKPAAAPRLRV